MPLLVFAFAAPEGAVGRAARLALIVFSTATAGRLLAGGAPLSLLKAGVVLMAASTSGSSWATSWNRSSPASTRRPRRGAAAVQLAEVGNVATDYADYFVSGLVGAILAAERGPQLVAAVVMLPVAEAWNQMFLLVDSCRTPRLRRWC